MPTLAQFNELPDLPAPGEPLIVPHWADTISDTPEIRFQAFGGRWLISVNEAARKLARQTDPDAVTAA